MQFSISFSSSSILSAIALDFAFPASSHYIVSSKSRTQTHGWQLLQKRWRGSAFQEAHVCSALYRVMKVPIMHQQYQTEKLNDLVQTAVKTSALYCRSFINGWVACVQAVSSRRQVTVDGRKETEGHAPTDKHEDRQT